MANNYVMGLKRSGLAKADMIDYIAGIFNNEATKYSCLKHVATYFDDKAVEDIANETRLRRLLKNSTEKVVRNIYELCIQEYKHIAQYRDDKLKNHPVGVGRADGNRFADGDSVGGNYSKNFVTFEQFIMKEDSAMVPEAEIDSASLSDDLFNKLSDIENQIKVYVSEYEIDPNYSVEVMESLQKCQRYVRRAMFNINENATFEREFKPLNESFEEEVVYKNIKNSVQNLIDCLDSSEINNSKLNKCKTLMERCLSILVEGYNEQF
jgi:hypothetical protein